jgi:hypothetical protein
MNMKTQSMGLSLACFLASQCAAQSTKTPYPSMAPLEQYLMTDAKEEISLARSAAPESVGRDAEVLTFTRHGFETAVKGSNGFVCLVARSWSAEYDDPDFWNPKTRVPICYDAVAARSQVAATKKRTQVALAGGSNTQVHDAIKAAIESKELPIAEPGSMSYMLSKQTYFSEKVGHWLPHLMFFMPQVDTKRWGAGVPGSPVMGVEQPAEHLTVFLVPVSKWSDGTPGPSEAH